MAAVANEALNGGGIVQPTLAYVGARLPALSETFVWRELFGLRDRGARVLAISVRPPEPLDGMSRLAALSREAEVVYGPATLAYLPLALPAFPRTLASLIRDLAAPGLGSLGARAKHLAQGLAGLALAWRLRSSGIGHVHAHMANVPTTIAMYAAKALDVPFSFTGHANDLFVHRSALEMKLRRAAFVACISHWHADFYRATQPGLATDLPVIRCSVAVPAGCPRHAGRDIVAVGRLVEKKGFDVLLRAFAQWRASSPAVDARLLLVGDGSERAALEALADELGIAGQVSFLGALAHEQVLEKINAAAVFALPCKEAANGDRDGIPVVLMEAMAAGRCTIAGDLPTIAELIEDGVSGVLVRPGDTDAMAAALTRVMADDQERTRLGEHGWQRVRDEFSDDVNQARLQAAFARAAAREGIQAR